VFKETADRLKNILESINIQSEQLNQRIEDFSKMSQNAKDAFPLIEDNLNKLTKGFADSVRISLSESEEMVKQQSQNLSNIQGQLNKEITETIQRVNAQTERIYNESATKISQQISTLDESLGNELNKALSSLGSQLTSLSSKFVNDYTPLTDKLREIVNLSRGVSNV